MKRILVLSVLIGIAVAGCGRSDEDLRQIVREELNREAVKEIIAPVPVIGPYSPAVRVGKFLFVSGQIAIVPETGKMEAESIAGETRQVLENLRRILASAGYDSSHVVSATVYLKNINDYQAVNAVYGGYFQEDAYPARVAVEVAALPREANLEISVIAFKP